MIISANYYFFCHHEGRNIHGSSFSAEYKPFNWFNFGDTFSYDRTRGKSHLASITFRYQFTNKKQKSPFIIQGKITQTPIRDLAVFIIKSFRKDYRTSKIVSCVRTLDEFVESVRDDNVVGIISDLNFLGQEISLPVVSNFVLSGLDIV